MKVDQCQPHENSWIACQSSQVVKWVKTKPGLAGNQIPFGGTRFGFTTVGVYNTSIIDTYTSMYPNLKGTFYLNKILVPDFKHFFILLIILPF